MMPFQRWLVTCDQERVESVERPKRAPAFRVATPCSLSRRVIASMFQPVTGVVLVDVA